jgi:hypothetical protein
LYGAGDDVINESLVISVLSHKSQFITSNGATAREATAREGRDTPLSSGRRDQDSAGGRRRTARPT